MKISIEHAIGKDDIEKYFWGDITRLEVVNSYGVPDFINNEMIDYYSVNNKFFRNFHMDSRNFELYMDFKI